MTRESWSEDEYREQAQQAVSRILRLAESDEACRILGVDGTLEDEVDAAFVLEPLEWIASEIAGGLRQAEAETEDEDEGEDDEAPAGGAALSTIVALLRLYAIMNGKPADERELMAAVVEYLEDEA